MRATSVRTFPEVRNEQPNPYRDATFCLLSRACSEAIRELEQRRQRTREEKEGFASRLRFLLLALAARFSVHESVPGSPEMLVSRDASLSASEAFLPWYRQTAADELRSVRRLTLWRAADYLLGSEARGWLDPCDVLWRNRRSYIGTLDDEKLLAVLRELDTLHRS